MTSAFKTISIRGRLAFGAKCVENTLTYYQIHNDVFEQIVIPRIWDFTTSEDFSIWDDNIREIDPVVIFDTIPSAENFDFATITFDTFTDLKKFYESISLDITDIVSYTIQTGAGNLYGGTGEYSSHSLEPLLEVLKICSSLQIPIPNIDTFLKAKFEEEHGWGTPRPREYYLND